MPDDMDSVYKSQKIGDLGLIMIVAGVVASLFAGCILDAVKKFKVCSAAGQCWTIKLQFHIMEPKFSSKLTIPLN